MAANNQVRVSLSVVTNELRQGVDQAANSLRDFQRNASRAQGAARIFGDALTNLGGISKGASGAIAGVLAGFATGGLIGVAIGGVNALVGAIKEIREESRKAAEAAAKHAKEIAADMSDAAVAVQRQAFIAAGGSGADFDAIQEARKDEGKAQEELARRKNEHAAAQARLTAAERAAAAASPATHRGPELEDLANQLAAARAFERQRAAAVAEAEGWIGNIRKGAANQVESTVADTAKKAAEKKRKADEDYAEWKRDFDRQVAEETLRIAKDEDEAVRERIESEIDLEREGAEARGEILAWEIAQATKARNKAADEAERIAARDVTAYARVGEEVGAAMAGVFTGATSAADGFRAILGSVVTSLLDTAQTQIMAAAAASAAEAYKSQAGIPVIGPLLGAAAASAAFALVKGMLADLPARRLGGEVLAGMPYLVGEEGPEVVVPRQSGSVVPNSRIGGVGGITVNVAAMDGRSVERVAEDNSSAFSRALQKRQRRGLA